MITKNEYDKIDVHEMRAMYEDFTKENDFECVTKTKFNKRLARILGCAGENLEKKSNGGYYYTGIVRKDKYEPPVDHFTTYLEGAYTFTPYNEAEAGRTKLGDLLDGYSTWVNQNGISDKPTFVKVLSWLEARQDRFKICWCDGCPWVHGLRKNDPDIDGSFENLKIA